jgi:hypothetical protein
MRTSQPVGFHTESSYHTTVARLKKRWISGSDPNTNLRYGAPKFCSSPDTSFPVSTSPVGFLSLPAISSSERARGLCRQGATLCAGSSKRAMSVQDISHAARLGTNIRRATRMPCKYFVCRRALKFAMAAGAPTAVPNSLRSRSEYSMNRSASIPSRSRIFACCDGICPRLPARTARPVQSTSSRYSSKAKGAALLKRRPAFNNLAVRVGIVGALATYRAAHFMRPRSLPEGSVAPASCVCALVRSEMQDRLASLHRPLQSAT